MIERLDHVNFRTARLEAMVAWYERVLEMHPGPRPAFAFPGAWLYAKGHPLVHLVAVETMPGADPADLRIEHAAFRATGLERFLQRLDEQGEPHRVSRAPGVPIVQVNIWDPDGNHLHVDFDAAEADHGM